MITEHFLWESKNGPHAQHQPVLRFETGGAIQAASQSPDLHRTGPAASTRNALTLGRNPWGQKSSIALGVSLHMVRKASFF